MTLALNVTAPDLSYTFPQLFVHVRGTFICSLCYRYREGERIGECF
jgi:hypothetical protein